MITTQTTLAGLVTELRASNPSIRRSLKELVRAVNTVKVLDRIDEKTVTRKGYRKEQRFAQIASRYVDLQELAALDSEEAREDAMDLAITRALGGVEVGDNPTQGERITTLEETVKILKDLHRLNTLRAQYERRGGSVSNANFGQENEVVSTRVEVKWIDKYNGGNRVGREEVKAVLS